MRRMVMETMVSTSDFETWDDYVRYRELNGYTEHELDCMYDMAEALCHMAEGECGFDEFN